MAAIAAHCGQAYVGKVVEDTPAPTAKDPFAGQRLVMHVRGCADRRTNCASVPCR